MNDLNTISEEIEHILRQVADMPPNDEESHLDLVAPIDDRSKCYLKSTTDENFISCYVTTNDSTLTESDVLKYHENLLRMTCQERYTSGFIGALDENAHEVIAKNINHGIAAFEIQNTLEIILEKMSSLACEEPSPTVPDSTSSDAFSEYAMRV
jgi:hypothetical protein